MGEMASAEEKAGDEVAGEGREADPASEIRTLLRIAIYNISYIEGIFPDVCFTNKSVPAHDMNIKKLIPTMDDESRRLVQWIDQVEIRFSDALKKKYLKTLVFSICSEEQGLVFEEYDFSFSYPRTNTEEVNMKITHKGSRRSSVTFKSSASEVTPNQMRSSGCKMIRTLVPSTRTLESMPHERTIVMKLLFYSDSTMSKNLLEMEVGNTNNKQHVLALKVKSVHGNCEGNNVDDEFAEGIFSVCATSFANA